MFEWLTGFVEQAGYLGIVLLMIAENVFPPIPSEVIMPLAGLIAARGDLDIVLVILAGTFGSVAGATVWYYVGRWIGEARLRRWIARHGRWWTLSTEEFDRAAGWFHRYAGISVLVGRMVPSIRTLISVPAGMAGMPLVPFLVYTTIGSVFWISFLALAGFVLESQYHRIEAWLDPISNLVIAGLVIGYLYRLVTFRPSPDGKKR